jgi:aminopeptidase N
MSAEMETPPTRGVERSGPYRFHMPQPIPSYLIALAVGDLEFIPMSERTGVYAEPALAARAAKEFEDTEAMMQATERLYGPYRWGRYDLLVLPPSFPFGGMENPRLTFATPTVVTGDKSLVSLVAHELAHSWSGNLVTNATWRDFWLNEGFTVYLENRIQEEVFGISRANMEAALEYEELLEEMKELEPRNQVLHIDLAGRDPDEGFTLVPYIKGMLLLRAIEREVGREEFDKFLRGYFDHFSFQSITTNEFVEYLNAKLIASHPDLAKNVALDDWLNDPGLPPNAPKPISDRFAAVEGAAKIWADGGPLPQPGVTAEWTTQEWLRFLRTLPRELTSGRMDALDRAFHLTASPNAEIAHQWLMMAVRNEYEPAYGRLEEFLITVGRRKFVKPLFEELVKTPEGLARAGVLYAKAKSGYHPITSASVEEILAKARARS